MEYREWLKNRQSELRQSTTQLHKTETDFFLPAIFQLLTGLQYLKAMETVGRPIHLGK